MPYRSDPFSPGQYYHIYNRGAGRGNIFFNPGNYRYLELLMARYSRDYEIKIIVYCLMPNHYHFLVRQESDLPVSKFLQVLFNSYVQAVNIQQQRTGTLFEGRFKYKRVDKWEYLVDLCRYVHRNPVEAKLAANPEGWLYSNYLDWIGIRKGKIGDPEFVRDHFPNAGDYVLFVNDNCIPEDKITSYLFD